MQEICTIFPLTISIQISVWRRFLYLFLVPSKLVKLKVTLLIQIKEKYTFKAESSSNKMDYTKDAVLIEAMKSLEDIGTTSSPQRNFENSYINSGKLHHPHSHHHHHHSQQFGTFSAMALLNTSEYIERNVKTGEQANLSPVLLMKGNGSLSSPSTPDYPSTSLPPVLEGSQYDDMMNDTMEYIPMSMRPETYIVPVLFAIIFIIGVIGNGTLIVIFIKHRSMRNVPNM